MVDLEKSVLLLSGGTININFAKDYLKKNQFDAVIAIDSGLNAVDELGITPDFIVGDFDSVSNEVLKKYLKDKNMKSGKSPIIKEYPSQKDDTDTKIGIELAISLKATKISILGGTGTRIDHLIGNVNLLLMPLKQGINAAIIDDYNKIYLINSNLELHKEQLYGPFFSLLPFTEEVKGVTLKGFKYPLIEKNLYIGDSIGISNEVCDITAYVELKQGILIAIEARD